MTQKNIIIGLLGLIAIVLLFSLTNRNVGWGMMGWMNDDMMYEEMEENIQDEESLGTPTSADNAPEGSLHNLPVPKAVMAVKESVASELNIGTGMVIVMSAYEHEWSDGCLGLGGPAESCLMAITPGYEVTVRAQGNERVFRTNADGTIIREENDNN